MRELEELNRKLQREIEERRAVEAELRRSHAVLEAIVDASPLSILAIDRQGQVTLWNPAAESLFGWKREEVLGQQPPHVPEPDREAFQKMLDHEFQGEAFREFDTRRQTKAGELVEVAAWTAPLKVDGETVGGLHILSDITERKKLERAREQLAALLEAKVAERTAELEQTNRELTARNAENELFVYSVSHDLRSPLVNLQGFSQELRYSCEEIRNLLKDPQTPLAVRDSITAVLDGDVNEAIYYIQTAVTNLSDILMSLLKLSRAGRLEYHWEAVEMRAILSQVLTGAMAEVRNRKASVEIHVNSTVSGDRQALEQAFSHLVSNALRYSKPDVPPQIEIGELPHGAETDVSVDASRSITYYVRDNGLGIPTEHQSKVFQAFQRLHPAAPAGEGIGLALTRRIIERHGGKIWFQSEAGVGTTFFVALPPASPADSPDPTS